MRIGELSSLLPEPYSLARGARKGCPQGLPTRLKSTRTGSPQKKGSTPCDQDKFTCAFQSTTCSQGVLARGPLLYVCIYVCMYIYICIYVYIYIHIYVYVYLNMSEQAGRIESPILVAVSRALLSLPAQSKSKLRGTRKGSPHGEPTRLMGTCTGSPQKKGGARKAQGYSQGQPTSGARQALVYSQGERARETNKVEGCSQGEPY